MKIKIDDIQIREDLYPRLEIDTKKIQEYSENIDELPSIIINQDKILIDGLHRLKAHLQTGKTEIECNIEQTKSENEIMMRAIELNARHGLQLDYKSKKSLAVKLYDGKNETRKKLLAILSISESTFDKWTSNKKRELMEERDRKIFELYLQCLTKVDIGKKLEIDESTVRDVLNRGTSKFTEKPILKDFEPKIYNIWSYGKQENDAPVFGTLPQDIIEQLLYYYTERFDVVYDPFGGAGITVDACKKWYRRYYVTDKTPTEIALTKGVKQWRIQDGIPDELPKPSLVFMDPPYWKQAKGKYSNDKDDLANMPLDEFYNVLNVFFKELKQKMKDGGYIAFIIGMTQDNGEINDHAYQIYRIFDKLKFNFTQRINVPYSTQQVQAFTVADAKKGKYMLKMYRDLVIFKYDKEKKSGKKQNEKKN